MNARKLESPSIPTRASLLSRIKDWKDQDSWAEFYRLYEKFVLVIGIRSGLTEEEARDAVQETFCQIAKNIGRFRYNPGQGKFKGWLTHTARWHISEQFRRRCRNQGEELAALSERDSAPGQPRVDPAEDVFATVIEEEWLRTVREAALARVRQTADPRQFQIFYFYVIKELPVREVARRLAVKPSQVYLAKHRIGRLFAETVKQVQADHQ